jgi:hypothetical protein
MADEAKPEFMTKLCPLMSIGQLTPNEKPLVTAIGGAAQPPGGTVIGCQGPNCALYVNTTDASGKIDGGGCSLKLSVVATSSVAGTINAVGQVLHAIATALTTFLQRFNLKTKGS